MADSGASGTATDSPGVLSGNVVQVPIDIPVNVCGNTANVLGLLNPASGNTCSNGGALPGGGTTTGTQATSADDALPDCGCTTTGTQTTPTTVPAPTPVNVPQATSTDDALPDCGCTTAGTQTAPTPAPAPEPAPATVPAAPGADDALADCLCHELAGQ